MPSAEAIGYESHYMARNLGAILITFFGVSIVPVGILLILRPFKDRKLVKKKYHSLANDMHGNMMIRYILEACLDIGICVCLQFYYSDFNGGLKFNNYFNILNAVSTIILGLACVLFLPVVVIFYLSKFSVWKDGDFKKKYGTVFIGLRKDSKWAIVYLLIFMARRICFAFIMVFANELFCL